MNYFNKSNLYVCSKSLEQAQVSEIFDDLFAQMRRLYAKDKDITNASFVLNTPRNAKGQIVGVTYAWVSSPKVYNMLIGRNTDGTERLIPDPEWQPSSDSWGDMTPDLIDAGPLVTPMTLDGVDIVIAASYVNLPDVNFDASTLCCRICPSWVTITMLHEHFDRYNTDNSLHDEVIDGKRERIKYPHIRLRAQSDGNVIAYVSYSKLSDHIADASFANQMCKRIVVQKGNLSAGLMFSFWRNGGRKVSSPQ